MIEFAKAMDKKGTDEPAYQEDQQNGYKHRLTPVKQAPIMKQPGKKAEFNIRVNMYQKDLEVPPVAFQAKVGQHLNNGCNSRKVKEGIVSRIDPPVPYYPYDKGNKNSQT